MKREVVKSYFEAIRLTLINHNMFDEFGAKVGTWIKLELSFIRNILTRFGTKTLRSRSSGSNEVTTVIATVNADGGKSLIDMVEILLNVMLMDILINVLHLLLDM